MNGSHESQNTTNFISCLCPGNFESMRECEWANDAISGRFTLKWEKFPIRFIFDNILSTYTVHCGIWSRFCWFLYMSISIYTARLDKSEAMHVRPNTAQLFMSIGRISKTICVHDFNIRCSFVISFTFRSCGLIRNKKFVHTFSPKSLIFCFVLNTNLFSKSYHEQ